MSKIDDYLATITGDKRIVPRSRRARRSNRLTADHLQRNHDVTFMTIGDYYRMRNGIADTAPPELELPHEHASAKKTTPGRRRMRQ